MHSQTEYLKQELSELSQDVSVRMPAHGYASASIGRGGKQKTALFTLKIMMFDALGTGYQQIP